VSLFQQRKNRAFNYIPRGTKSSSEDDAALKAQWGSYKRQGKRKAIRITSLPVLLVILGMIVALLYVLMQYETT
jgi:cytoskeletal protein RodZ